MNIPTHCPARILRLVHLIAAGALFACGPTSAVQRASSGDAGGGSSPREIDAQASGGAASGGAGANPGGGGTMAMAGGSDGSGGGPGNDTGGPEGGGTGGTPAGAGGSTGEGDGGADEVVALPPDLVPARQALLVVGDPAALTAGDTRLKSVLETRGFAVLVADDAGSSSDAARMDLVAIGSSSASAMVAAKFKDVPIPVLDLESAIYDDMKMTGPGKKTDFDEEDDRRITIVAALQGHPLAAGQTGTVTVNRGGTDPCCGINWGKPAASAAAIANYTAASNGKIAIFGYEKGAKMIDDFVAPARRVGFFAADTTMEHLSDEGLKLLNAAITWLAP